MRISGIKYSPGIFPHIRKLDDTLKRLVLVDEHFMRSVYRENLFLPASPPMENWMYNFFHAFAKLYWRCDAAPFYTSSYHQKSQNKSLLTKDNFLEIYRACRIRTACLTEDEYPEIEDCERYVNNAKLYWKWMHGGCDCDHENESHSPGQRLLDNCIEEQAVDLARLITTARNEKIKDYETDDDAETEDEESEEDEEEGI